MRKSSIIKVLFVTFLGPALKIVLDLLGHFDFIYERYHNPGWLGVVYNHIMAFSPTFNFFVMLIILGLLAYLIISKPKIEASSKQAIFSQPSEEAELSVIQFPLQLKPNSDGTVALDKRWISPLGPNDSGRYRWSITIYNDSRKHAENKPKTIKNVRASIDEISPCPIEAGIGQILNRRLQFPQRLQLGGEGSTDVVSLAPDETVNVQIFSCVPILGRSDLIQLEGSAQNKFVPEQDKEYIFYLRITGDDCPSLAQKIKVEMNFNIVKAELLGD